MLPEDCAILAVPLASDFKVRNPFASKLPSAVTVPNELPAVILSSFPNLPVAPGVMVRS